MMHGRTPSDFKADIDAIAQIEAIPSILDVVCHMTGMGFAAVARVTEDRWVACGVQDNIQFGLQPGGELKIETTICHEIRQKRQAVIIENVSADPIYCNHQTPLLFGFQSYISMPIVMPDGTFFGTLCAIDPQPQKVHRPEVIGAFKLFAEMIAFHLDAHRKLALAAETIVLEREGSELREQFIAVLGHDLRNPLAAVKAGTDLLIRYPERSAKTAGLINDSISRMTALIDNVLDFARGRLGGGFILDRDANEPIEPILAEVVQELESTQPDRVIKADFAIVEAVSCDRVRMAQLLSNLLGNALTHGDAATPVRVRASTAAGIFELSVSNTGKPIPEAALENLFQPFFRASVLPSREGLGLGLYIASEIAKAHGGELTVKSDADETRFTLRMPTRP